MLNRLFQIGGLEPFLYNEHGRIITRMKSLGYPANSRGMCFGISHMGTQAILADELKNFVERIDVINRFAPEELANKVNDEYQKLAFLIQKLKADNLTELETKLELKTGELKEEKLSVEQKKDLDEKFKVKLKRIYDTLSSEERHLLEISAFFDGVQLLSSAFLYRHLLEDKSYYQNAEKTFPLILSKKLSETGGIVEVASYSGVYAIDKELPQYFLILYQSLTYQSKFISPFTISLSNLQHAVTISYDFDKESWIFIDANQLPVKYCHTINELCEKIAISFKCTDKTAFNTLFFTTKNYSDQLREKLSNLLSKPKWKEIHAVTANKAYFMCPAGVTWLECASNLGHIEVVNELLNTGMCLNTIRALAMATQEGHHEIVNAISANMKEFKQADSKESPPLVLAALGGYTNIVKTLLEQKHSPDLVSGATGSTALLAATSYGHVETVKLLLEYQADPNKLNPDHQSALFFACINENSDLVDLLLQFKAVPDQANIYGVTPLLLTCSLGNVAIINLLLKYKANINHVNNVGITPLSEACHEKRLNAVKLLLSAGANSNTCDAQGITPLIETAINGSSEILLQLLEYKAAINNSFNAFIPALIEYAEHNHRQASVKKLLGKNYSVFTPNYISGFTALHMAAYFGYPILVQALIDHGADVNSKSANDISALEMAQAMKHSEITNILAIQAYKVEQKHTDFFRRDAISKLLKLVNETKSIEAQEKHISDFKEIDIPAQRLAKISIDYKPDNAQRIKCLNELNTAIAQAYQDYVNNQSIEIIVKSLKDKANAIALLAKTDHEKSSTLFSIYGKKSVLESKINEITQPNLSSDLWFKLGLR